VKEIAINVKVSSFVLISFLDCHNTAASMLKTKRPHTKLKYQPVNLKAFLRLTKIINRELLELRNLVLK